MDVSVVPVTTTSGYLSVWPSDQPVPVASLVDFKGTATVNNSATIQLSSSGQLSFYGPVGPYNVIVDVNGYVTSATSTTTGATYVPVTESRVVDTRSGSGGYTGSVGYTPVSFTLAGVGGIPTTGVAAVVADVGVVSPTATGSVQVWPDGTTRASTGLIQVSSGQTLEKTVTVPLGSDGKIAVATSATGMTTPVVIDIYGYYLAGTASGSGSVFVPVSQTRILALAMEDEAVPGAVPHVAND